MASIFKQQYTVADPKNPKVRVTRKSTCWYIDYKAADGTRNRVKGYKDKAATLQLAAQLERETELAESGVIDQYKKHRKRPLAEFRQGLFDISVTAKHAEMTYQRVKRIFQSCGIVYLTDFQPSAIQKAIGGLTREVTEKRPVRDQGRKKFERIKVKKPLGIKSKNYYLKACKQFFNWMVDDKRIGENPLNCLKVQNADSDIRRKRRALSPQELNMLIKTASEGETLQGLTGGERSFLYLLAACTGLRASELASLQWSSFDFSNVPTLTVKAAYTKNRKEAVMPLRQDVTAAFKLWQTERNVRKSDKVFPIKPHLRWHELMKKDLAAAGLPYKDDAGRVADFHALRHSFITNVVKSGASPKEAQALARHSKIGLTLDTYTHIQMHDQRGALEAMTSILGQTTPSKDEHEELFIQTGTVALPVALTDQLTNASVFQRPCLSSSGTNPTLKRLERGVNSCDHKPIVLGQIDTKKDALTASDTAKASNEDEGARTLNLRIDSPML